MFSLRFLLLSTCLVVAAASVLRFRQRSQARHELTEELRSLDAGSYLPLNYIHQQVAKGRAGVGAFSWENCGDASKELFLVKNLSLTPDPIVLPGTVILSFDAVIKQTVSTPLRAEVQIKKKFLDAWVPIPCIDNFGSCTYDDFCEVLPTSDCPPAFKAAGVPCQCPFSSGNYDLPPSSFSIDVSILPPGGYFFQISLSMKDQDVGCYQVYLTLN